MTAIRDFANDDFTGGAWDIAEALMFMLGSKAQWEGATNELAEARKRFQPQRIAPSEKVFRTMSQKEFDRVLKEGGLVIRQKGSSELGVTLNASYIDDLAGRAGNAKRYAVAAEIELKPGTFDALISKAAVHPSAAHLFPDLPVFKKGMNVPQVKMEKDGVISILLGNSPEAVEQFNNAIIRIGTKQ